jgi:hypothetical protein
MKSNFHQSQRGQSLVLVAILLVVFIGMLAVVLDGGYGYLQRRAAQTAADAGALAGASEWCETGIASVAVDRALEYAITRNEALNATATITEGIVRVETEIPFSTFFGMIFNRPQLIAAAEAEAGCFAPGEGVGVLPIAYSCADGVFEADDSDPFERYCDLAEYSYPDDDIYRHYLIMNSNKTDDDIKCMSEPGGTIDCDIDNDGIDELLIGGNRSWLDLSGAGSDAGNGSNELCSWIENGYPRGVEIHTWFAGQPGVSNNVFKCVNNVVGTEVYLPVYDAITYSAPGPGDGGYHNGDGVVLSNGNSVTYYHVISFAKFVPTCIHSGGGDRDCDLYNAFRDEGILGPNDKTIEGYFLEGFATGLSGKPSDGVYVGAYTVYLIK